MLLLEFGKTMQAKSEMGRRRNLSPVAMRPHAFTLVELLVVVAIIMLLMAILLPALNGARASAKKATCISGARQVYTATVLFASDNNLTFPAGDQFFAYQAILTTNNYITRAAFTRKGGCPYGPATYSNSSGDSLRAGSLGSGGTVRTSYGLNFILQSGFGREGRGPCTPSTQTGSCYYGPQKLTMRRIEKFSSLVAVIHCGPASGVSNVLVEVNYVRSMLHVLGHATGTSLEATPDPMKERHERMGLPIAFADGHAEFVPAHIITQSTTYPIYTPPWRNDPEPKDAMGVSFQWMYRYTPSYLDD